MRQAGGTGGQKPVPTGTAALTMSELKGFPLALRAELLVRDQTLVLCLKAARTLVNTGNTCQQPRRGWQGQGGQHGSLC